MSVTELRFEGYVTAGIGHHRELFVPGRAELATAAGDWPKKLEPGSLNVRVTRYPDDFVRRGLLNVRGLDTRLFRPAFVIPSDSFGNNRLGTDGQVWRARIDSLDGSLTLTCWALRRLGSGLHDQLEFVGPEYLRGRGLQEKQQVSAILIGVWVDSEQNRGR